MVPVGRIVVLRTMAKSDLIRAVAIITWPGLAAPLVGPPLGGFLADAFSWRAIFLANVPLGAIAAVPAFLWTPRLEPGPAKPFDSPASSTPALRRRRPGICALPARPHFRAQ